MSVTPLNVIIIGGGLGGLCLAHGLKQAGIGVAVYERDQTPTERLQGYRIHLEASGNEALHACLPPHLFETYLKTSGSGGQGLMMRDEKLRPLVAFKGAPDEATMAIPTSRSVSRITLRQILLSELENIVHFNKAFSHYCQNSDGTVTAFFEDGTSATGTLLVGADGGNSRVRQQLLPQAKRLETGTVGIMGKVLLTPSVYAKLVAHQLDWATIVLGPNGRGFFSAVHNLSDKENERSVGKIGTNEATHLGQGKVLFDNTSDYYFWAFVTKKKNYAKGLDLQELTGEKLLALAQMMTKGWHPTLEHLISLTDTDTVIATPLRIASEVKAWQNPNVTLLGDAIHSMPPTRGIGGNTALRDAQLLTRKLSSLNRQEQTLARALDEYVTEMLAYSFKAVKSSKQSLDMLVMENGFGRAITKTTLRSLNFFMARQPSQASQP